MRISGVLRVHFTAEDLTRVRLAGAVDPMWEITLSLHLLQNRDLPLVFDQWRRKVLQRVRRDEFGKQLSFLTGINPPARYFPDFLTPGAVDGDLAGGVERVRSTPAREFRAQLSRLAGTHPLPSPARALADGEPAAADALGTALLDYHRLAIAPYLPGIGRRVGQVRDRHRRQLAADGIEVLLGSLPRFRWHYPVLEAAFPEDFDLHLDGRGLLLVPAFFCVRHPIKLFDPGLPPILVFPVAPHDPTWLAQDPANDRCGRLALLIGATRAEILTLIGHHRSAAATTISAKLHLSASAVSYHTKILRESGLLDCGRDGPSVIHRVTPLGTALLDNTPP